MNGEASNSKNVARLMLRLLPVQLLLAMVGSVNGMISSYFASNFVGVAAMTAVGLFAPIQMLFSAIFTMLAGGSVILCGKYLGQNEHDRLNNNFSVPTLLPSLLRKWPET